MEISDVQNRRAVNIIWNAAADYTFTPDFKAYDAKGLADIYWNCVIGAVRRHYEYPKLEKVFLSFGDYEDSDVYEGLLWLGLENSVFALESPSRPALESLRRAYAQGIVALGRPGDDGQFFDLMAWAHYTRALGREPELDSYSRALLDELEFSPDLTTDEIVARAKDLFEKWFQIRTEERRRRKRHSPPAIFARKSGGRGKPRYRKFFLGFADHPKNIYGGSAVGGQDEENHVPTRMTAAELREFMETKYGKSVYSPQQTAELELPHPRMTQRAFVLVPLAEIAPEKVSRQQLQTVLEQRIERLAAAHADEPQDGRAWLTFGLEAAARLHLASAA